jgi:hypothetical protein
MGRPAYGGAPPIVVSGYPVPDEIWYYGPQDTGSWVMILKHMVVGWNNRQGDLKVWMGDIVPDAPAVRPGSTKAELLAAMGTPRGLKYKNSWDASFQIWSYGDPATNSMLEVENGIVIGWFNRGSMKVSIGDKVPGAPPIQVGSTVQDVVNAMGTPDIYTTVGNMWYYGSQETGSSISFGEGKVQYWYNNGNLNAVSQSMSPLPPPSPT